MKKLVLYGNTEFTRLLKYYIDTDTEREIAYCTVDLKYMCEEEVDGIEVIPYEELINIKNATEEFEILICVGYSHMNDIRKAIYEKCKRDGFEIASYVHISTKVPVGTKIGEGNVILEDVTIQPFCEIGNGNLIWYKAALGHNACIGNFNTFCGMSSLSGFITVRNNCFIGNNVTLRDHIYIEDYTLIGAGTYVSENTEKYSVHVPAKDIVLDKKSFDMNL